MNNPIKCFPSVFFVIVMVCLNPLICAAQAEQTSEDAVPEWTVQFWNHGPDPIDTTSAISPGVFIERLNARPECDARFIEKKGYSDEWHAVPDRFKNDNWLSLNLVVYKRRLNLIALRFDPADQGVIGAAWRPALASSDPRYSYINTIPPGPDSVFELCQIELASEFARMNEVERNEQRPLVKIRVTETEKVSDDLFSMDEPIAASPMGSSPAQLKGIEVLALAAAWQTGLKPTMGSAPNTLTLRVARTVDGMQVSVEADVDGKKTSTPTRSIHADSLYTSLRALVAMAWRLSPNVLDVVQVDAWPIKPLLYHDHKLLVQSLGHADKNIVRLYDAQSLMMLWQILPPERRSPRYVGVMMPDGPSVVSYTPSVERWRFKDGSPIPGDRWREANHPWGFEFVDSTTAVSANDQSITIGSGTARNSMVNDFGARVDAGPTVIGDRVFAGASSGLLRSIDLADASTKWQTSLSGRLFGRIIHAGDLVLVATQRGRLYAVSVTGGTIVWERDLGDALIGAPVVSGDGKFLVAVYGNTSIARISLADGALIGETARHPTAAAHMVAVPDHGGYVAVVDLAGTVTFFRLSDLSPVREVKLNIRPIAQPLYIADAPHQWSGPTALADSGPVLLVPAADGVCYLLDVPK